MIKAPLVSIIIPTYNYGCYIGEAIDSIFGSRFSQDEIEIIVVDDGSTDHTQSAIAPYQNNITYIVQNNRGKAWATKVGIDASTGHYIFNLDADDLFSPRKIRQVIEVFEQDRDIVHVAHPALCWDMEHNSTHVEAIPEHLLGHKLDGQQLLSFFYTQKFLFGGGSTFAGRGDVLRQLPITEDIDMFIDEFLVLFTLNQGCSFFIREPLSVWRIHGKNYSDYRTTASSLKNKLERSLESRRALLSKVLSSDFDPVIKTLCELNFKVACITSKETLNQKQTQDIIDLWQFLLSHSSLFKKDLFQVIKAYTLLNRSLPTFLLKPLQQMKQRLAS